MLRWHLSITAPRSACAVMGHSSHISNISQNPKLTLCFWPSQQSVWWKKLGQFNNSRLLFLKSERNASPPSVIQLSIAVINELQVKVRFTRIGASVPASAGWLLYFVKLGTPVYHSEVRKILLKLPALLFEDLSFVFVFSCSVWFCEDCCFEMTWVGMLKGVL